MYELPFLILDSNFISLAVQNILNDQESYQLLKNKTKSIQSQLDLWYAGLQCHSKEISDIYFCSEYRSYSLESLSHIQILQAPLPLTIISKNASSVTLQQHHRRSHAIPAVPSL